ncbi:MAG: hypothetical protein R3276_09535 [Marinobacter sp.]|nr:hypothetical protein [Marinobacter sp.]
MGITSNRIIGLTQELSLEKSCNVVDLHVGWQNEYEAQQQKDSNGHNHRAPVVTWQRDGVTYQFVPTLTFEQTAKGYVVDADRLIADIEEQLLTRGVKKTEAA